MRLPDWSTQTTYDIRFDWGEPAAAATPAGAVAVIVDVLRFSTAVEAAAARGVVVYPYRWHDDSLADFARSVGAVLLGGARGDTSTGRSLSSATLMALDAGSAVVVPSPNGSTCAVVAADAGATVVAGCLRNATAVARWVNAQGPPVRVVACGERWPDGSLRPALEDLVGAGAIIARLNGTRSPEAQAAVAVFADAESRLAAVLAECASGRELILRGWRDDVAYASHLDGSEVVPVLRPSAGFRPADSAG